MKKIKYVFSLFSLFSAAFKKENKEHKDFIFFIFFIFFIYFWRLAFKVFIAGSTRESLFPHTFMKEIGHGSSPGKVSLPRTTFM